MVPFQQHANGEHIAINKSVIRHISTKFISYCKELEVKSSKSRKHVYAVLHRLSVDRSFAINDITHQYLMKCIKTNPKSKDLIRFLAMSKNLKINSISKLNMKRNNINKGKKRMALKNILFKYINLKQCDKKLYFGRNLASISQKVDCKLKQSKKKASKYWVM